MAQFSDIASSPAPIPPAAGNWRAGLDAVTQGICAVDQQQLIVFANRALCQLTGLTAAELAGRPLVSLFARTAVGNDMPGDVEGDTVLIHPTHGSPFCLRMTQMAIDLADAPTVDRVVTLTDITEDSTRIRRLEAILSASGLATWEWNVQTGEVVFNTQWAAMLGYTLAELSPLSVDTWVSLVHPDDLTRANTALARHFRGESDGYQCDCRLRHKDGSWIWITTRGRVITRTPEGNPALVYGTHTDITQTKRVMEALQQSEHSYELMALGTPSALYDWDIASDTITWRGKSYEVLGRAGNLDLPMRSVDFQNWVHPDDWARYRRTLRRYFRRETQVLHDDLRLVRPDGSMIWVAYHGAALWEKGRARRMFGSFTDVSLAKRDQLLLKRTSAGIADALARLEDQPAAARDVLRALARELKPRF